MVMAVRRADFPPAVSSGYEGPNMAAAGLQRRTSVMTDEEVHFRAEVDCQMGVVHKVDDRQRLDYAGVRRSLGSD